jgi:hypothetical protein
MPNSLAELPIRKKQALAALCLAQFCAVHRIEHPSVTQLIEHLLSILVTTSLPEWDRRGSTLELAGRGDPLPEPVKTILPKQVSEPTFRSLIDHVVEVGLVNLYGALTDEPFQMLQKCIEIIGHAGVSCPVLDDRFYEQVKADPSWSGWGDPLRVDEYQSIMDVYRTIVGKK